ncbi:MAG: 2-oxoacid:acceptor oxidoreductase subunit alpha [Thermoplasmata archaeon]|nr:2-oxoacid:acceptor oxidoreductase subunit alpha [Thermoplasmata archaeon]
MKNDYVIRIGGAAGDGVQSSGILLSKTFTRHGLHVFGYNYYQDLIRGGNSWYQIRVSDKKVKNQGDGLDILIALNEDSLNRHTNPEINEGGASYLRGIAIFDESIKNYEKRDFVKYIPSPLNAIASGISKNPLLKNTVALGMVVSGLNLDLDIFISAIKTVFKGKSLDENIEAAKQGFNYYKEHYEIFGSLPNGNKKKILIGGGEAVGLGAAVGGIRAYVAYPMTPASSTLHWLASHSKDLGIFIKVPEDEISAINTVIGMNYAGIRAMTGSSGGGYDLMHEGVGLAAMLEIPVVIYESQRAGPSTGLPTKTEQGDLLMIINSSHGDYPRAVIAPGDVEEAYYYTREALNLADKYQMPVFIVSDLYLSERIESVEDLNLEFKIDRGLIANENDENFLRYKYTDDGISPRAFPGMKGLMHNEDSDEHDERGDVVSDAITDPVKRKLSVEKRMKKLETLKKNLPLFKTYRLDDANIVLVQWGSTKGVVEESADILRNKGYKVGVLEIKYVFPFNTDDFIAKTSGKKIITIENNYSGQLANLIKMFTGVETLKINKYNGEAFYPSEIVNEVIKLGGD